MDARARMINRLAFDRLDPEEGEARARRTAARAIDSASQCLLLSSTVQKVAARKLDTFESRLFAAFDAEAARRGVGAPPAEPKTKGLARAHAAVEACVAELKAALANRKLNAVEVAEVAGRLDLAREHLEELLEHE